MHYNKILEINLALSFVYNVGISSNLAIRIINEHCDEIWAAIRYFP